MIWLLRSWVRALGYFNPPRIHIAQCGRVSIVDEPNLVKAREWRFGKSPGKQKSMGDEGNAGTSWYREIAKRSITKRMMHAENKRKRFPIYETFAILAARAARYADMAMKRYRFIFNFWWGRNKSTLSVFQNLKLDFSSLFVAAELIRDQVLVSFPLLKISKA